MTFPFTPATMLAPMEGVSHPLFRAMIAEKGGVGVLCTEFVRISRAPIAPEALRREVVKHPGVPLSVQVMGNDADKMADAARVVAEAGADVVDVNLGCPMPRVVRKGVGAAMLKDRALLRRVLGEMRAAVPGLLSAKIRAGFDDGADVVSIAKTLEDAGIDFLAVHPRRRCDYYDGVADWRIIQTLREALSIPVVGNGDVWYAADALRMRRETGCAAVMIGRPAVRNPWIFTQIASLEAGLAPFDPSGDDLLAHLHGIRDRYGEVHGRVGRGILGKLKEQVKFVLRGVPDASTFERDALRTDDVDTMLGVLEDRLAGRSSAELDFDAHGRHRLERSGSTAPFDEAA